MDMKPKISPNATYIFDDDAIDEFDEFSLSTILDESEFVEALDDDEDDRSLVEDKAIDALGILDDDHAATATPRQEPVDREPTIDELMSAAPADPDLDDTQTGIDHEATGTFAALEILLDPEVLFPKDD
jgi:hypothetical protein